MLTFEECCAMCGLTEALVEAIAEHEDIPEIVALELGAFLLEQPGGAARIVCFIEDDIADAHRRHNARHEHELLELLARFRREYASELGPPDAAA